MFDDSLSFRLMRHRYGVGILFVLLEREKAYQNEIRRILGAEIQPIAYSLAFLLAEGLGFAHLMASLCADGHSAHKSGIRQGDGLLEHGSVLFILQGPFPQEGRWLRYVYRSLLQEM